MAKLKHLTSHRASREAIDNFCVMYNVTAQRQRANGKRSHKIWCVKNAERGVIFTIGVMQPIEVWVQRHQDTMNMIFLSPWNYSGSKTGRWSSCPPKWFAVQKQMQSRLHHAMVIPPQMLSLENLARDVFPKSIWLDEMKDIDARVNAVLRAKLDDHLLDAMIYGTSVYGSESLREDPVPNADRSDPSGRADGHGVPRVRPKFMGIGRSRYASALRGSHRHDEVRAQMESSDDRRDRKAKSRGRIKWRGWRGQAARYLK